MSSFLLSTRAHFKQENHQVDIFYMEKSFAEGHLYVPVVSQVSLGNGAIYHVKETIGWCSDHGQSHVLSPCDYVSGDISFPVVDA